MRRLKVDPTRPMCSFGINALGYTRRCGVWRATHQTQPFGVDDLRDAYDAGLIFSPVAPRTDAAALAAEMDAVMSLSTKFERFFQKPFWFVQHPGGIVVSERPGTAVRATYAPECGNLNIGMVYTVGTEIVRKRWTYAGIADTCTYLDKVSNCVTCANKDTCVTDLLSEHINAAEDDGTDVDDENDENDAPIRHMDIAAIEEELIAMLDGTAWQYVRPTWLLRAPFRSVGWFYLSSLNFSSVEDIIERVRGSARAAVLTKKYKEICAQKCAFHGNCDRYARWTTGVTRCHTRPNHYYARSHGPYLKEELEAFFKTHPYKISRDAIEFLIANSGVVTYLGRQRIELGTLDTDLENVRWVDSRRRTEITLSYADTRKLLKIPYKTQDRAGNVVYQYPAVVPGGAVTDEMLHTYMWVCARGHIPHAKSGGWGTTSMDVRVVDVSTSVSQSAPSSHRLRVYDGRGNSVTLYGYGSLFSYWGCVSGDFDDFLCKTRLGAESGA